MIVVIGGTGFIGKSLLLELHKAGRRALSVSRQPDRQFIAKHATSAEAMTLESFRADPAAALFGCSAVVYLATTSTPGANSDEPWKEAQDNLDPLIRLLNAVQRYSPKTHVVFLSSGGAIYGRSTDEKLHEASPLNPISPYGLGKLLMENTLQFMARTAGLRTTILRPSNPIGHFQTSRSQGVVGALMRAAETGDTFPMLGDGSAIRDYFDVADLVTGILSTIDQPQVTVGEIFNIGSGEGYSVKQMLELVENVTDRPIAVQQLPARHTDVDRVVLNIEKMKAATGWLPAHEMRKSLEEIWRLRDLTLNCP